MQPHGTSRPASRDARGCRPHRTSASVGPSDTTETEIDMNRPPRRPGPMPTARPHTRPATRPASGPTNRQGTRPAHAGTDTRVAEMTATIAPAVLHSVFSEHQRLAFALSSALEGRGTIRPRDRFWMAEHLVHSCVGGAGSNRST